MKKDSQWKSILNKFNARFSGLATKRQTAGSIGHSLEFRRRMNGLDLDGSSLAKAREETSKANKKAQQPKQKEPESTDTPKAHQEAWVRAFMEAARSELRR